ncbi:cyclic nucleotide-binding domain-containing protein [Vagococcus carniphilus]|nr:cyclic nucleotide-binding domain-containing protein [Vagococcus carniphilus]QNN71894.1 cyclic nucleotide-binding domain-containing protein [Vagococcus carniphilus]
MKKIMYPLSSTQFTQEIPGIDADLLAKSLVMTFKNGEFITKELTELRYLYFIMEGRAKVVTTQSNGKKLILQFLSTDDMIGDLTVIKAEEEIKDVIAMGETTCLAVPIQTIEMQLMTNNEFLRFLSQYIGIKLLLRMDHFKEQQTLEAKMRLAKLLLEITVDGEYHEKHTEIAEYLGVSYRHYMHTFKQLKEEGYIYKKENRYYIQTDSLEKLIQS